MKFGYCKKCSRKGVQPNRVSKKDWDTYPASYKQGRSYAPNYCKYCGASHNKVETKK